MFKKLCSLVSSQYRRLVARLTILFVTQWSKSGGNRPLITKLNYSYRVWAWVQFAVEKESYWYLAALLLYASQQPQTTKRLLKLITNKKYCIKFAYIVVTSVKVGKVDERSVCRLVRRENVTNCIKVISENYIILMLSWRCMLYLKSYISTL